ncbi:potassium ABC transporter permease [Paenibacillus agaridevorans]|uniref:Potassium ABC transporter permease n=1 Tax=Paenibacillus agaridevorans TaxID=171404 RepID=A0A2R5EYN2_9BACL|nr:ABC transporter permease [Paenibacillus agaridevorans]GBG11780.1 potassium ABC transporter permease [Paenibacillus agaridevorans]
MNSFWTVVGFTIRNKVKGKAFVITTLIIALVISIGINLPYIIEQFDKGDKATNVGYVQMAGEDNQSTGDSLKAFYEAQENPSIVMVPFEDQGDAAANESMLKKAIEDGEIKGYLEFGTELTDNGFPVMTYKSEKLMEFSMTESLQGSLILIRQANILKDAGLSNEQMAQLSAPIKIDTVQIYTGEGGNEGSGRTPQEQGVNMGVVYVMIIFLFMAIMTSGNMIASEITAEKSSRVMEILITSVSPLKQMFGKIFGMFVVVIIQVAFYIAVILGNASMPHNKGALGNLDIDLSLVDPLLIIYAVLFFFTGFFLFATLYAAVGSIVSRTEDLGQAVMPMTFISLAGFYIAIFSISTPDSMLVTVTSYIPLFSPFTMLLRLGLTEVAMWETLLSFGILLVSIYVSVYVSAKIYRTGVLMYGKRPSWKEIRKAMKAYKI